jgi:hypothetical protein
MSYIKGKETFRKYLNAKKRKEKNMSQCFVCLFLTYTQPERKKNERTKKKIVDIRLTYTHITDSIFFVIRKKERRNKFVIENGFVCYKNIDRK